MSNESKFKEAIEALNERRDATGIEKNGKKYSMVKDRVEVFRKFFGSEFGIRTHVDYDRGFTGGSVIVATAEITDANGFVKASGHAMEFVGSNEVSSTSPIEACETSAIGRALACFGLHGGEFASDFEMVAVDRKAENRPREEPRREVVRDVVRSGPQVGASMKFYLPKDPHAIYTDLAAESGKVADEISMIENPDKLSAYWTALAEFRNALDQHDPELLGSVKAAFAVQHDILRGNERNN